MNDRRPGQRCARNAYAGSGDGRAMAVGEEGL